MIVKTDAQVGATAFGITNRHWRTMVRETLEYGFLTSKHRMHNGEQQVIYLITGVVQVAKNLGCDRVGSRKALIDTNKLLSDDGRAYLWAAYLATLYDRPVSRATMREQTGVPERTQYQYESIVDGIEKIDNYAITDIPGQSMIGRIEYEHVSRNFFIGVDPNNRKEVGFIRLPDQRTVNVNGIGVGKRGSSRRVNRKLAAPNALAKVGQGWGSIAMSHASKKSLQSAEIRLRR